MVIHHDQAVLHDKEITNFFAQEDVKNYKRISFTKSTLNVDDPKLLSFSLNMSKDQN